MDDEVKGEGNSYDFGSRNIYDGRIGKITLKKIKKYYIKQQKL